MEDIRKVNKQAIILDIAYWVLNFIVTPLIILFTYILLTEENGIIDSYIRIFGDKSTDDGWEYLMLAENIIAAIMFLIFLVIVLINNILIYLKFANDFKLRQYIDDGDINSVFSYSKKYNFLIKMSFNPFFAVSDNKMRATLVKYQQFNYLMK